MTVARCGEGEVMWMVGGLGRIVEDAKVESTGAEEVDDV